jgi:hypothetical protein
MTDKDYDKLKKQLHLARIEQKKRLYEQAKRARKTERERND